MHILVTGGLGFIGSHLCERLLAEGHTVVCVDDASAASGTTYLGPLLRSPGFRWVQRRIETLDFLPVPTPDLVIHLAAKAGVRASLEDPLAYVKTNVEGTTMVLEACRRAGVSRMIFASSSSVYGHPAQHGIPSCEDDPPFPLSPYGATKVAGEALCRTYATLYGMDIIALRFFSVYGPRQRPDLALPTFARLAREGQPLPVFGDGSACRDYTSVLDIVEGICKARRLLMHAPIPGRSLCVNLGSGRAIPLHVLISTLLRSLDVQVDVPIVYRDAHPADADHTQADIRRAWSLLGWEPRVDLTEGVQQYLAWAYPPRLLH